MNTSPPPPEDNANLQRERIWLEIRQMLDPLTTEKQERLTWLQANLPPLPDGPSPEAMESIQNYRDWFRFQTPEKRALKDSILERTELGHLTTSQAYDILESMRRREIYGTTAFNEHHCHLAWQD